MKRTAQIMAFCYAVSPRYAIELWRDENLCAYATFDNLPEASKHGTVFEITETSNKLEAIRNEALAMDDEISKLRSGISVLIKQIERTNAAKDWVLDELRSILNDTK